jgi:hypothetical protein
VGEPGRADANGLRPTTEFMDDGHVIDPSVSVPIAVTARFAAIAVAYAAGPPYPSELRMSTPAPTFIPDLCHMPR